MTTGEKITAERKARGLRQEDLGALVGLSKSAISKIENDELKDGPDRKTLDEIAEALEASSILTTYCENCLIRNKVLIRRYPELNNIERTPMVIFSKVVQEMKEGIAVIEPLIPLMMRKDFKECPEYQATLEKGMMQLFGSEQSLEILIFELIAQHIVTPEKVQEKRLELREHCVREGHHLPGKTGTEV